MFCKSCCSTYGDFELCTSCYRAQHVQQVRQRKELQGGKVAAGTSASSARLVLDEAALSLADKEYDEQVRKRGSLYVGGRNAKSVADQRIREATNKKRSAQELAQGDTMPSSGGKVAALGDTISSSGGTVSALGDTTSSSRGAVVVLGDAMSSSGGTEYDFTDSEAQLPIPVTVRAGSAVFACVGQPTRYANFLSFPSLSQGRGSNQVELTAGTVVIYTCHHEFEYTR